MQDIGKRQRFGLLLRLCRQWWECVCGNSRQPNRCRSARVPSASAVGLRFIIVESNNKYVFSSHAIKVTTYDYIIIAPVYIIIAHIDSYWLNVIFLKFGE